MGFKSTEIRPFGPETVAAAAALIRDGQPVAVPTETVYGLAADATNAAAVARIYEAKGRPSFNPLIVHVPDIAAARRLGEFDTRALALAEGSPIASLVTAGLSTIALRVPAHPVMQALLDTCDRPLAAPSANASGRVSPTRADHVLRSLDGRVPLIIDGGPTAHGLESTIVAATGDDLRLLRPGPIEIPDAVAAAKGIEAPGMMASHYAPSKPLRLQASTAESDEFHIGLGPIAGHLNLSPSGDLVEAAARLFDALHAADDAPQPRIAVARVPHEGLGRAINDRLARAAAPRPT